MKSVRSLPSPATESHDSRIKSAGYSPIPNAVYDEAVHELTFNEMKVLLFVLRRTVGWRKLWDEISYSQFTSKTPGRGAGLPGRTAASKAIDGCEDKGWIRVQRTRGKRQSNEYSPGTRVLEQLPAAHFGMSNSTFEVSLHATSAGTGTSVRSNTSHNSGTSVETGTSHESGTSAGTGTSHESGTSTGTGTSHESGTSTSAGSGTRTSHDSGTSTSAGSGTYKRTDQIKQNNNNKTWTDVASEQTVAAVVAAQDRSSEDPVHEALLHSRGSETHRACLNRLLEFGVSESRALELMVEFPLDDIEFQMQCEARRRPAENTAGRLIKAIEEKWPAPRSVKLKRSAERAISQTATEIGRLTETRRRVETSREIADAFIATMAAEDREALERKAREVLAADGMTEPRRSVLEAAMRELVSSDCQEPAA